MRNIDDRLLRLRLKGIGNPLVDHIFHVSADTAPALGFENGSVNHIARHEMDTVLARLPASQPLAGGGAATTCRVAAMLGAETGLAGCVGADSLGAWYQDSLERDKVLNHLSVSASGTGVFCTLILPDGSRTLIVSPGAARELVPEMVPDEFYKSGAVLYLEGFLAGKRGLLPAIADRGRRSGMECVLDLGNAGLVRNNAATFTEVIDSGCAVVFANEAEFLEFTGADSIASGAGSVSRSTLFVLKAAERGSIALFDGKTIQSPVRSIADFDETGAGDVFAAGFLVARARGLSVGRCLRAGNRLAEEAIQVAGSSVDPEKIRRAAAEVL